MVSLKDGSLPRDSHINYDLYEERILDLIESIQEGKGVGNENYYRQSSGRDYLLSQEGWLHLHIGHGIDDNVLLIVEQTADQVIIIKLTDHKIFDERPRGKGMFGLKTKIAQLKMRKAAIEKAKADAAKAAAQSAAQAKPNPEK